MSVPHSAKRRFGRHATARRNLNSAVTCRETGFITSIGLFERLRQAECVNRDSTRPTQFPDGHPLPPDRDEGVGHPGPAWKRGVPTCPVSASVSLHRLMSSALTAHRKGGRPAAVSLQLGDLLHFQKRTHRNQRRLTGVRWSVPHAVPPLGARKCRWIPLCARRHRTHHTAMLKQQMSFPKSLSRLG